MPYSLPAPLPAPLPVHSMGRPRHRRSFTDEKGHGAFAPVATSLPKRRPTVFLLKSDSSSLDDSSDDDDGDNIASSPPPLKLKTRGSSSFDTAPVPFPRKTPSPVIAAAQQPTGRPHVSRTASAPQTRPLKSSLKSSSSSGSISTTPATLHQRAHSVPTSPTMATKNVHFPSQEEGGLESICFYSRRARPNSISLLVGQDEDETETETDTVRAPTAYPFPRFLPKSKPSPQPKVRHKQKRIVHEFDTAASSPVPAHNPSSLANVHLESLVLHSCAQPSGSSNAKPSVYIKGTLLVRNFAYEKTVALRFTLDDWHTTSEVLAHHAASLSDLPPAFFQPGTALKSRQDELHDDVQTQAQPVTTGEPEWDRFSFTIKLDDYAPTLSQRTLWLVARYSTPYTRHPRRHARTKSHPSLGSSSPPQSPPRSASLEDVVVGSGGEWWDNNGGRNYKIEFVVREEEDKIEAESEEEVKEEKEKEEKLKDGGIGRIGTRGTVPQISTAPLTLSMMVSPPSPSPLPLTSISLPSHSDAGQAYQRPHPLSKADHPHHPVHRTARAETTLAHLKGLHLKNYAAPTVLKSPVSSPVNSPSAEESVNEFSFGMMAGHPATLAIPRTSSPVPMPVPNGRKTMESVRSGLGMGAGEGAAFEASTSPPGMSVVPPSRPGYGSFPAFGGVNGGRDDVEKERASLYWPWGATSSPAPTLTAQAAKEPCGSDSPVLSPGKISREGSSQSLPLPASVVLPVPDSDSFSSSSGSNSSRCSSPVLYPPPPPREDLKQGIRSPVPLSASVAESGPVSSMPVIATRGSPAPPSLWSRLSSSSPTMMSRHHTPTPPGVVEDVVSPDSVYQTFVKKWCFAHEGVRG